MNKPLNVYILSGFPGCPSHDAIRNGHVAYAGTPVRLWEQVKDEDCVLISYTGTRDTSRWVSVERKRPYQVIHHVRRRVGLYDLGWHASLSAAVRAAQAKKNEIEALAA